MAIKMCLQCGGQLYQAGYGSVATCIYCGLPEPDNKSIAARKVLADRPKVTATPTKEDAASILEALYDGQPAVSQSPVADEQPTRRGKRVAVAAQTTTSRKAPGLRRSFAPFPVEITGSSAATPSRGAFHFRGAGAP